jgi:hypothetical protein
MLTRTLSVNGKSVSAWRVPTGRHNVLYVHGIISLTDSLQLRQKVCQLEEVLWSEVRPSARQDHERIGSVNIRPVRW